MRRIVMAACLLLAAQAAWAQGDDAAVRRGLAGRLLVAMNLEASTQQSFAVMRQMLPQQLSTLRPPKPAAMSEETAAALDAAGREGADRAMEIMAQELTWAKVKDDFTALYADTFSADELRGLITFYESPAGRALVAKQPELMKRSMELGQKTLQRTMPKILETLQAPPAPKKD